MLTIIKQPKHAFRTRSHLLREVPAPPRPVRRQPTQLKMMLRGSLVLLLFLAMSYAAPAAGFSHQGHVQKLKVSHSIEQATWYKVSRLHHACCQTQSITTIMLWRCPFRQHDRQETAPSTAHPQC